MVSVEKWNLFGVTPLNIVLFLCKAEFSGQSEVEYAVPPEVGSEHSCILFMAQSEAEPDFEAARACLAKYGWIKANISRAGPFAPESVNSDDMKSFQRYYEECLEQGDSVAWNP